jgi:hypothetical protein
MNDKTKKILNWSRKPSPKFPTIQTEPHFNLKTEGYQASYAHGVITIKGNNKVSSAYGELFIQSILPSQHWPEFLGVNQPCFPFRPIWLDCHPISWLASQDIAAFHLMSEKIHELGYNALILGGLNESFEPPTIAHLAQIKQLLKVLNEKNIQLVLNLSTLWQNPQVYSFASLLNDIQDVPMILVSSGVDEQRLDWKPGKTHIEAIDDEIHHLQSITKDKFELIYYLPYSQISMENQPAILQNLSLSISPKTYLAFSAVAGNPAQSFLHPHPFWNELRNMQDPLGIRLLPIMQVSDSKWHSLPFDLFESYFPRCFRHRFAGVAAYASNVPAKDDLHHCNLWVASQMQWKPLPPAMYIETWFKSFRTEFQFTECMELLRQIRTLTLEISKLSSHRLKANCQPEEIRWIHENLISQLNILALRIHQINTHHCKTNLAKQFAQEMKLFINSAEKKILESSIIFGININNAMTKIPKLDII